MATVYGYARISTQKQNIERQVRNITEVEPNAVIIKEIYTGTKVDGREMFEKLLKRASAGDTIIFDSVSRMSRNASEGIALYKELNAKGINLRFIKEPYVNTEIYKAALNNGIELTGNEIADEYIKATNKVLMMLAEKQVAIAFEQAEKEVKDLRQRTKEGIETARLNGKQIGRAAGTTPETKKAKESKDNIFKMSKDFLGNLSDTEIMKITGLARNTYYKYKKELTEAEWQALLSEGRV